MIFSFGYDNSKKLRIAIRSFFISMDAVFRKLWHFNSDSGLFIQSQYTMKKTILVYFALLLCTPLFIACSDDEDIPELYTSDPKADIDFKEATLSTIQGAIQGSWVLVANSDGSPYTGEERNIIIKGDKIAQNIRSNNTENSKWYDIYWNKTGNENGEMYYFSPKLEDGEAMLTLAHVPYKIVDNILYIGYNNLNPEYLSQYRLLMK